MKLEYNILWIDNDIQEYIDNGEVNNLEIFLSNLGFEPTIITVEDEDDLDDHLFRFKYDLIISDFNLNATTGDVVIEKIRIEKGFSTEILFYTAKSNFRDRPDVKERLAFMDRITFHSNRDTFLEKVEKLIELTLDKLLELNATRGLITAETSDLDVEIEEIYYLILDVVLTDENKPKLEKIFKTDYKEIKKGLLKKCKSQRDCHLEDFKLYFTQSDAFRKWDILKEIITLKVPPEFDLDLFKRYSEDVITIRNKFAHAREEKQGDIVVLKGQVGQKEFQFDKGTCIDIRKKLILHKANIRKLKAALQK